MSLSRDSFGVTARLQPGELPLCVDLDGSLLQGDLLWECFAATLRRRPWLLFFLPFWLVKGRAHLKHSLSAAAVNVAHLPYHAALLQWLREERLSGRKLILASASNGKLVAEIADHLGIFDGWMGSTESVNLKGPAKLERLRESFPEGFDYCGDSATDVAVWDGAAHVIAVGNSAAVRRLGGDGRCVRRFDAERSPLFWIKACRPLHWVKNLLVFVPVVTGHRLDFAPVSRSAVMFLSFSLCASAVYLLNDVLDLNADRQHSRKRERPVASGRMPIPAALGLAPVLLALAAAATRWLGSGAIAILTIYFIATTAYSTYVKRLLLGDVIGLALLYMARIVAGHVVTGIAFSPWQLSFALLMFVSLAFGKRVSEMHRLNVSKQGWVPGRGYRAQDIGVVRSMGVATGVAAVVVFSLYLNSDTAHQLYAQWELLWCLVPALLYWIMRLWVLTDRGAVTEDPIVFAATDRVTYFIVGFGALTMFLATRNLFPHLPVVR